MPVKNFQLRIKDYSYLRFCLLIFFGVLLYHYSITKFRYFFLFQIWPFFPLNLHIKVQSIRHFLLILHWNLLRSYVALKYRLIQYIILEKWLERNLKNLRIFLKMKLLPRAFIVKCSVQWYSTIKFKFHLVFNFLLFLRREAFFLPDFFYFHYLTKICKNLSSPLELPSPFIWSLLRVP